MFLWKNMANYPCYPFLSGALVLYSVDVPTAAASVRGLRKLLQYNITAHKRLN